MPRPITGLQGQDISIANPMSVSYDPTHADFTLAKFLRKELGFSDSIHVTSETQDIIPGGSYIADNAIITDFKLPPSFPLGASFEIVNGMASGVIRISQRPGQSIFIEGSNTTEGVLGKIESTDSGSAIICKCVLENNRFMATSVEGSFTSF